MLKGLFRKKERFDNSRPNIVMILLDQFRNDARVVNPIFEEMGRRGVLFSKTITYAPYTLASLHATFTGMYGRDNGVDAYTKSDQYKQKECYSLPEYLKDIGYYTHGYTFSKILLPNVGFDSLQIIPEKEEKDILASHKRQLDICYTKKKPFFCFLHYGEIHHHIVKDVIRKYSDFDTAYFGKIEYNMARYMEHAHQAAEYTAELIRTIDSHDSSGHTMIIVLTDHGGGVGEKAGEKAYGVFTYDYSICIWVYFICPKLLPIGKEYNVQIRTIDILPTIMDLLEIKPSQKHKLIAGRSLLPIINGEESGDRYAFSETGGVEGPYPSPDKANIKCIRDGRWKLIFNSSINKYELYDLEEDPSENHNLYLEHREKAEELFKKMVVYL
ncbi:MAG: sulfatase-like hydrolase/transferase [Thermodesulfobacteriota bacterium]